MTPRMCGVGDSVCEAKGSGGRHTCVSLDTTTDGNTHGVLSGPKGLGAHLVASHVYHPWPTLTSADLPLHLYAGLAG